MLPTYQEVQNALKKSPGQFTPAQVHGLMCGLICGTSGKSHQWETLLFANTKNQKTETTLRQLYESSYQQINEFSLEFSLLLPDDTSDINTRAEELGVWCQGFLTGLEQAKVPIENREPSEVSEAIDDLIEISKVSYGSIAENEDDETSYIELVEYVRLAALMIFYELKPKPKTSSKDVLH